MNHSNAACHVIGYPGITFQDAGGTPLPFIYERNGDQVVTSTEPENVNLAPGTVAYIMVNKYRCDTGEHGTSTTLRLIPPNETSALTLDLSQLQGPRMVFCGPGDPGSVVHISPVEPTPQASVVAH